MEFIKHSSCNHQFGPPRDVSDAECGTLPVKAWRDPAFGQVFTSFWKPSASELEALNAGGSVAVNLYTTVHPVMSTQVYLKDES